MGVINNVNGVRKESFYTPKTILFDSGPKRTISCMVANTGVSAGDDGRKIIKAGSPVKGDLTARQTAFTLTTSEEDCAGVLLHDADVTDGNANATLLIFGSVDLNKLDETTEALITANVKTKLAGKVTFIK